MRVTLKPVFLGEVGRVRACLEVEHVGDMKNSMIRDRVTRITKDSEYEPIF